MDLSTLLYFTNRLGKVAFSVDEGMNLVIHTGKKMPWNDAWVELEEDGFGRLSEAQLSILDGLERAEARGAESKARVAKEEAVELTELVSGIRAILHATAPENIDQEAYARLFRLASE